MSANEIRAFAKSILHGDKAHQDWLLEAAEKFIEGQPDLVEISLPNHAVEYLKKMCERERVWLNSSPATENISLGGLAAYDSLNIIESSLP